VRTYVQQSHVLITYVKVADCPAAPGMRGSRSKATRNEHLRLVKE